MCGQCEMLCMLFSLYVMYKVFFIVMIPLCTHGNRISTDIR